MKTKIKFLFEADSTTDVFAYMPYENHAINSKTAYSHIGQHSACSPEYAKHCKPAPFTAFEPLLNELKSMGYDVEILNRITLSDIVPDVNCKYGAPMGRHSSRLEDKPVNQRIYTKRIQLIDGYDKGGAYWGNPNNLYCEYTKDLTYIRFYRN